MKKSKFLILIAIVILVAAVILRLTSAEDNWRCQNGEWLKHGRPRAPKPSVACPRSFTEQIAAIPPEIATTTSTATTTNSTATSTEEIIVNAPQPNEIITSPLLVSGQAKGNWFFEASLPIKLVDMDNKVIVAKAGQAKSDWMTEKMVPFSAVLEFKTKATSGLLIISRDNPSGLPQNEASISIPVKFK